MPAVMPRGPQLLLWGRALGGWRRRRRGFFSSGEGAWHCSREAVEELGAWLPAPAQHRLAVMASARVQRTVDYHGNPLTGPELALQFSLFNLALL